MRGAASMRTLIKNGHVINPITLFSATTDILIDEQGKIIAIEEQIDVENVKLIDATGYIVTPGLVDIHVHFRDPGFPDKETLQTGALAAARGGFTSVVCMPNTKPSIDSIDTLNYVLDTAKRETAIHIYSSAAITQSLEGKQLTNFHDLYHAGAVTFTDDGRTVMDPQLLYQAFTLAKELGVPISSHCEDHNLIGQGAAIHLGEVSKALDTVGIHPLGEELVIARDILFAEAIGTHVHIQHVSTARGVQLIREAKQRGVHVTAEAAPHHFTLTDEQVLICGSLAKVNPPLRTQSDVEAIVAGLIDGTLDVIATDHAPHTMEEKSRPLEQAPFGMVGLETSVGLAFTQLVHTGMLSVEEVIAKMTLKPARIMNLPHGVIELNCPADITIIDPQLKWVVDADRFASKSRNTPFNGMELTGKTVLTMANGEVIYDETKHSIQQTGE